MANKRIFEITGGDGTSIYIEYNDVNLKVGSIYFTVPAGVSAYVLLWNEGNLVYENIYGEGFHSENVPGNYQVTEYIDPEDGQTYAHPPQEISWSYSRIKP